MRYIYTGEQAKEIDQDAISTRGFPGLVLMERAAMTVAAVIMQKESKSKTVICVCGMGNNGGDGVAVARLLRQARYTVAVCPIGDPQSMSSDMSKQLEMAVNCNVPIVKSEAIPTADVIVDAIFGIGLSKHVTGVFQAVIEMINEGEHTVYAVDVPSGINATTGKVMGTAVYANETITLGVHKIGLILHPGCEYAGNLSVGDIGFPTSSIIRITNPAYIYEEEDVFRLPLRPEHSHKGTFKKVLVIAGCETMSGACFLAAKAAYKMGAGLVKVITTANNREIILGNLPEVLFSDYENIDNEMEWADVIVIGPGLGLSQRAEETVQLVCEKSKKPTIIDGDGLTLLKDRRLAEHFILTPHIKEMSRLTGGTVDAVKEDIIRSAKEMAENLQCNIVLKDSRTVVSNGEEVYVNVSGNSGMATGGSGDVLAGIIGGLLAGGMSPFEASKLGVYLHGMAGDWMAKEKGKYAMLASDLFTGLEFITKEV